MNDQAKALRGLMEQRANVVDVSTLDPQPSRNRCRTIAVTSGKGGVGKSNIALNLGITLARMQHTVCLLDANLGLGNIDLLCGLNGYWNLAHVVNGARTIQEITLAGPAGIHVIPGASGLPDVADCPPSAQREILAQLEELELTHDYLIIDTGTGIHHAVRQFLNAADTILIVTTPEPPAIADAYATIKTLSANPHLAEPQIVVNQAETPEQARDITARLQQTARTFLHIGIGAAGSIPHDPNVARCVVRRTPFVIDAPHCPAARGIDQLARRIINLSQRPATSAPFFSHFGQAAERAAA